MQSQIVALPNYSSDGEAMSSPAARRAMRSEIVRLSSTMVMSTLVDCICGVWNLRSFISASTRLSGSSTMQSMSNCEISLPVLFPLSSFSSMVGVKYCTECCLRNVFSGLSLLGVPAARPPSRPRPSPALRGIVITFMVVRNDRSNDGKIKT